MPHSFSLAVSMNLEHSIKEGSHERYPVHLQCLRNIKKIKYPDFQAMTLTLIFWNTTQIEYCISRTLATNMEICQLLAEMRGSKCCVHDTKFIKLHKQPNHFALLPSEYLSKHIDLWKTENHIYCTQYSNLWWELRGTASLMGSTMMKALGFDRLKAEKQYVSVYIKKASTRIHR